MPVRKHRKKLWRGLFNASVGLGVFLCVFLRPFSDAGANPFEETIQILENSTSFHWGRDCLVWIVHYPEELVEPWVESEAGRVGMTESERESYKEGFVSGLSLGTMEPFLLTVYAFGPRPLDFSPISEKVALITSEGERVKPSRYDRTFDQPVNGVVQGLIFFPKQRSRDFALALRGMGVYDERVFSFSGRPAAETTPADGERSEVVIVDLPILDPPSAPPSDTPKETPKPAPRPKPAPKKREPKVIEGPRDTPPAQPVEKAKEPVIVVTEPESSQSMAEFVESMRSGDRKADA